MMFAVIDNGPGISEAERSKILEVPNFQGESAVGMGGIGLGLRIAKKHADLLGGSLNYYPVEPHGGRFEVIIPV
jgi:signal transduction histidine kinase